MTIFSYNFPSTIEHRLLFNLKKSTVDYISLLDGFLIVALKISFYFCIFGVMCAIIGSLLPGGLGDVLNKFFSVKHVISRDDSSGDMDIVSSKIKDSANLSLSLRDEDKLYLEKLLKKHRADNASAWMCIFWTILHFLVSLNFLHFYPCSLSIILMGMNIVRNFMIFHDACHMSFFPNANHNKILSQVLSTFVPQSSSDWTASHNFHHSHLGDSSFMDLSLTIWFNKSEYEHMPFFVKLGFRIIRDPILLPFILSAWVFIIFPFIKSPLETLLLRLLFYAPLYFFLGWRTTLLYLTSSWVGGMIGLQLFHLQHQCNTPYRVDHRTHSSWDAGILGSTHLLVSWPINLMTLGIEFHHIHHASTRVPGYNLAKCHSEGEAVFGHGWCRLGVNRVGPVKAFLSSFHTLFDSNKETVVGQAAPRFVSFEPYQSLGLHD